MKGLCSAAKYQSFAKILVASLSPLSLTHRLQSYCVMDHSPAPELSARRSRCRPVIIQNRR
ncbi:hypothetical protein MES4922_220021 [Mesorhizobium ventifaucium]|uniref:Uncharacterized protein n=1 Tax=Mesorhizobium ventifaucium TaxID=666020 RepID=A0ABM9DSQ1_9HYPH|nr:hypothetical protein MES4922_220021 [Mesorhizobium ventifaucium]